MDDIGKDQLREAWARRCSLIFLGQARFNAVVLSWAATGELSAETALDKLAGERLKALAERQWLRAVLKHAGNVKITPRWNVEANDFGCLLGNGLEFVPLGAPAKSATQPNSK